MGVWGIIPIVSSRHRSTALGNFCRSFIEISLPSRFSVFKPWPLERGANLELVKTTFKTFKLFKPFKTFGTTGTFGTIGTSKLSSFDISDPILYFCPCSTAPIGLTNLGGRKRVQYRI
jgi:hypothetical protein